MKQVVVERFGGIEELKLQEVQTPNPGAGEIRVRLTSIGMNHAELMARRGEYKLSSGEPPFIPGLEGGGIVDAVGDGVDTTQWIGKRVILSAAAPRIDPEIGSQSGTYKSHFITSPDNVLMAPDNLPDDQLGTLWLAYLTSWGCLVWKQQIAAGHFVGIPAASSSVGLAAAQIARRAGAVTIGLTTSQRKADALGEIPEAAFDHIVVTNDADRKMRRWHRDLLKITDGHGVDVFFDPVGGGEYLDMEIRALAERGAIWIYGLLGKPGQVDMSPLIRKRASIHGWILSEVYHGSPETARRGYSEILQGVSEGTYKMPIAKKFGLDDVQHAHAEMEKGAHIGKLVLVP